MKYSICSRVVTGEIFQVVADGRSLWNDRKITRVRSVVRSANIRSNSDLVRLTYHKGICDLSPLQRLCWGGARGGGLGERIWSARGMMGRRSFIFSLPGPRAPPQKASTEERDLGSNWVSRGVNTENRCPWSQEISWDSNDLLQQ